MRTNKECVALIKTVLDEHNHFWDSQRAEMRRYRDVYENRFWQSEYMDDTMIRVETSDCFSYVEGFIASLFSRNPAVVVAKDASIIDGNAKMAQAVVNRFLFDKREQLEIASRLALIYPSSFLKLSPTDSTDMLEKVSIRAIPCWEIIVDMDSSSWDEQRYIAHTYYLSMPEVRQKFGSKKFTSIPKVDYFTPQEKYTGVSEDLPDDYLYIQVVEFYDLAYDKLYFWSPNYRDGGELLEKSEIPIRSYDDKPMTPICPLFYARKPEKPMCGMSAVCRVYDQFYEKNILRTYWANAVRRDSRQYLYKEGSLDEEALAKITAGVDGAMIPVDEPTLDGIIRAVGVEPLSGNFDRYLDYIEQDINRGSILAPFSRGEATKATATEVTALAQYSASEIGKLARERDNAIEVMAITYLRIISLLAEDKEQAVIEVDGLPKVITVQDLDAKFKIVALDQSSTPLSEALKRSNLVQLLPVLTQLGVPPEKIKEELIRIYDLPESFLEEVVAPPAPPQGMGGAPQEDMQTTPGDIGAQGELPSAQLAQMLNKQR
tara:strand:+ start:1085 stop:2722 length:1638 start_codon:yes stop_codon:yes gene_type:complete